MTLKIHSTEAERLAEYRICQERGHEKRSDLTYVMDGERWWVCKYCGTGFSQAITLFENNKPEGAE